MSQLCGPGSSAPLGQPITGPSISMSSVNAVFQQAGALFAQITSRVLNWVQQQLESAGTTVTQLATKVAAPITSGLNLAEATVAGLGTVVKASSAGQLAGAVQPTGAGGTVEIGVKPWQFQWNVFQDIDVPAAVAIISSAAQPASLPKTACFRGGFDDIVDAVAFKSSIVGSAVPASCRLPGGPAAGPPPGPPPAPLCPTGWHLWQQQLSAGRLLCLALCSGDTPSTPGWTDAGPIMGEPFTTGKLPYECTPSTPPAGECLSYNVYSSASASIDCEYVCSTDPAPVGKAVLRGSGLTLAAAQAAVTTCNVPPPPPPTGGPPGICCDPTTGKVLLPDCIMLDLCDWKKFEDALVNALCRWYQKCVCKLDNETAYQLSDCEGELTTAFSSYLGSTASQIMGANDLDTLANTAVSYVPVGQPAQVDPNNPFGLPPI